MGGPPNGHLGGTKSLDSHAPPTLGFLSLPLRCWKAKHGASCAQPSRRGEPGRARNPGQSAAAEIVATARGAARRRGAVVEATVITSLCAPWAAQGGALSAPEPQGAGVRAAEDRKAVGSHPPSPARGGPVGSRQLRAAAGNGALARPAPAGSATRRPRLGPFALIPLLARDPTGWSSQARALDGRSQKLPRDSESWVAEGSRASLQQKPSSRETDPLTLLSPVWPSLLGEAAHFGGPITS